MLRALKGVLTGGYRVQSAGGVKGALGKSFSRQAEREGRLDV